MRFVKFALLFCLFATPAFGQGFNDIFAWNSCKQARIVNQPLKVAPVDQQAIDAHARAAIAVDAVPAQWRGQFSARLVPINTAIQEGGRLASLAEGHRAFAEGAYAVIAARVAANNWAGVGTAATSCTNEYWKSTSNFNLSRQTYGGAAGAADALKYDAERFVSMLEAFEDFYGPTGGYGN